ncbi:MAG: protein translocase subunit SecD [Elusimicrobia bacterium]|nr:protein translocase subunit SecD [Elusimicrobiota bacterium]
MKWALVLGLVVVSAFFLYPTVNWYTTDAGERAKLEAARLRPRWLLNLGLDLKGGTHLIMEVEVDKLQKDQTVKDALTQAIEVIRNRVDQFGVGETLIARQGERWIVVQLPGITDSKAAKEIIGKTALLEFRMVDSSEAGRKALQKIAELGAPFHEGKVKPEAEKLVPPGTALLPGREDSFYLVSASAPLTGAHLRDARVQTGGDYGLPVVDFKLDDEGGKTFGTLTGNNVGTNLAIILDGIVYSAPVIKGRIGGGSGYIEGNFKMDDARALAVVLRAGALPAPVRIIEERTVGPTLGEDSIRSGRLGCLVGIGAIFVFFVIYYKLGGLFTDVSLTLNLFFLLGIMAYLGSTLTLPGIAGIALNVAMAVDANILILERIREELGRGKPFRLAVESGFDQSASAIFDSNLTVLCAGLMLFQFGTGPIKGFAVTLSLGTIISMFTSQVCTRMMFDAWFADRDVTEMSL